jgi:hypothetical protein
MPKWSKLRYNRYTGVYSRYLSTAWESRLIYLAGANPGPEVVGKTNYRAWLDHA